MFIFTENRVFWLNPSMITKFDVDLKVIFSGSRLWLSKLITFRVIMDWWLSKFVFWWLNLWLHHLPSIGLLSVAHPMSCHRTLVKVISDPISLSLNDEKIKHSLLSFGRKINYLSIAPLARIFTSRYVWYQNNDYIYLFRLGIASFHLHNSNKRIFNVWSYF